MIWHDSAYWVETFPKYLSHSGHFEVNPHEKGFFLFSGSFQSEWVILQYKLLLNKKVFPFQRFRGLHIWDLLQKNKNLISGRTVYDKRNGFACFYGAVCGIGLRNDQ